MVARSPHINVMVRAAEKAARGLVRDFGEVENLQVSKKGPSDFVSAADRRAEGVILDELRKARPDYGLLMEESGVIDGADKENVWIVDPLDGTTNFLHGLPHFSISIALQRAGEIVAGLVFDPLKDELFWCDRGQGAFVNSRRMRVSARRRLDEAVIATGIPFNGHGGIREHAAYLGQMQAVMAQVAGIRRYGSAALDLAYVAAGRFDGFWEEGLQLWDVAAGVLLVQEAGGFVSEVGGGRNPLGTGSILAANGALHLPLGKVLRDAGPVQSRTAAS